MRGLFSPSKSVTKPPALEDRVFAKPVPLNYLEHLCRRGATDGIAPVGGSVCARSQEVAESTRATSPECTERKSIGDSLGPTHAVGHYARSHALPTTPFARAPETALDLIKEQKEVVAVTKKTQTRKEVGTGYMNSSLSLHRLHQDSSGPRSDGRGNGIQILERKMNEPIEQRRKALLDLLLSRCRDARHRSAVKGVLEREDFVASGSASELASEFD